MIKFRYDMQDADYLHQASANVFRRSAPIFGAEYSFDGQPDAGAKVSKAHHISIIANACARRCHPDNILNGQ
jgi:hypothetical protein